MTRPNIKINKWLNNHDLKKENLEKCHSGKLFNFYKTFHTLTQVETTFNIESKWMKWKKTERRMQYCKYNIFKLCIVKKITEFRLRKSHRPWPMYEYAQLKNSSKCFYKIRKFNFFLLFLTSSDNQLIYNIEFIWNRLSQKSNCKR